MITKKEKINLSQGDFTRILAVKYLFRVFQIKCLLNTENIGCSKFFNHSKFGYISLHIYVYTYIQLEICQYKKSLKNKI